MPTHAETRHLPFKPAELYKLVADVESYPEFLPWCVGARIRKREQERLGEGIREVLIADLVIGFKMVRERYTSRVELNDGRIDVAYIEGPFKYLNNHWIFRPAADGGTDLDFSVDFEFRNRLLQGIIGALFNEAVKRMVLAFEHRAEALYKKTGGLPSE
ncbi:type II toxin-antitoxin system RatA family toxin [Radicibacter daui]|uniref:type II toxin-antitoxin system RatA family toxin n=1 Tax=Radicibacter daui TaxID=3064829 RepID=UPI004046AFB7